MLTALENVCSCLPQHSCPQQKHRRKHKERSSGRSQHPAARSKLLLLDSLRAERVVREEEERRRASEVLGANRCGRAFAMAL